jgi:hemerythrin-like domain-containing protein
MAGSMIKSDAEAQRKTANKVVEFLRDHILAHAEWEERHLYPAVDKRVHAGEHPFTASMRYEHRIIGRWIDELRQLAAKPSVDAAGFVRNTDRLLGLITAHFEEEEEVLLPILDQRTTKEELEKELGLEAHGHKE